MNNTIYAKTKYVRGSARKARLVADMVRGKNAIEALDILQFVNKYAAHEVRKTLKSAVSNAVHNNDMDKESLIVKEIFINEAPTYKRGRAVSKGRYHKILKRNSHIIVGVGIPGVNKEEVVPAEKEAKVVKSKRKPAAAKKETKLKDSKVTSSKSKKNTK